MRNVKHRKKKRKYLVLMLKTRDDERWMLNYDKLTFYFDTFAEAMEFGNSNLFSLIMDGYDLNH